MRHAFLIFCLCFSLTACGKPLNIKDNLHDQVRTTHVEVDSYKTARTHLFGELHYNNGIVTDVYCEEDYDHTYGVGKGRIPNPEFLNCEHTWPQSKFGNENVEMKKVDLHHLYPVYSPANSLRSNHPFGYVSNGEQVCSSSTKGKIDGTRTTGFEPPDSHKGNAARAMFYFSTRYNMPIDPLQEKTLREWHKLDRVDAQERFRNRKIQRIQGNLNPFIDNPSLVDEIDDF